MWAPKSIQGFLVKTDFVQCEQYLIIVSVKSSFWNVNKMYFGTEARLLKAEGSQEATVEVKGASSGDIRAVGNRGKGRGRENSVTGKGRAGIFQQGGLVRRRKNHLYFSLPPPLLHYPLLLVVLLEYSSWLLSCTLQEHTSQGLLMGQEIEG